MGCGTGGWLRMLLEWGALPKRLHGVDLLEDRIAYGRSLSPPELDLKVDNACGLSFADGSVDLCTASTIFSSILDFEMRLSLAQEMTRVARRDSWIMIYDFVVSSPGNQDTIGIGKNEILRLFPRIGAGGDQKIDPTAAISAIHQPPVSLACLYAGVAFPLFMHPSPFYPPESDPFPGFP